MEVIGHKDAYQGATCCVIDGSLEKVVQMNCEFLVENKSSVTSKQCKEALV